jgi:hypothetical protein
MKKAQKIRGRILISLVLTLSVGFVFYGFAYAEDPGIAEVILISEQYFSPQDFPPGDADSNGVVDVVDVVFLIDYLFKNGPAPLCFSCADANCDDNVSVSDVVYLINFLFNDGPPPCTTPSGSLLDYFGCKPVRTGSSPDSITSDQDCLEYQYDGEGTFLLNHINAGFNCCPSNLTADITIQDNVISITEYEHFDTTGPCYCLCLFDVNYQIDNLPPGEYTIEVIELYLEEGDEPLEFTVDLPAFPYSGSYCVTRDHYPWGF